MSLDAATSVVGMLAGSAVPLTKVVGRVEPFPRTTEALANSDPVTASVKEALPEITEAGFKSVISAGSTSSNAGALTMAGLPPPLTTTSYWPTLPGRCTLGRERIELVSPLSGEPSLRHWNVARGRAV